MILIKNVYAFILYVSDTGLQCNKHNIYWYRVQYHDRQTVLGSWYGPVEMILPSSPAREILFSLVRTTTLGQSVCPDIALHISNYYISMICLILEWLYFYVYLRKKIPLASMSEWFDASLNFLNTVNTYCSYFPTNVSPYEIKQILISN